MEERILRPATSFGETAGGTENVPATRSARRFESPTIQEISLCCEISAYAPDGDDRPLF
ncbi:MAG: hypothetical protein JRF61_02975 [Deltaproteobacteria bacterium]|jgi:hypothetical protein|nr:hypothetical protein [Deltaproteobacteria bacterium]